MTLPANWTTGESFTAANENAVEAAVNNATTTLAAATATPTASTLAKWDASANMSANQFFTAFATTATAAGTTTLTVASAPFQEFSGTTTQTVKLPTTGIPQGATYLISNKSTGVVTVQSSAGNTILALAGGTSAVFYAEVSTPTTAANWSAQYGAIAVASGKGLTVSNTLTFVGTDGTTITFPSSATPAASTLAEWDANINLSANAFIPQLTSTATAAGTTTLTITSDQVQVFTGTSTQTVLLPTTGVAAGAQYNIINNSTGQVTVESSGAGTIQALAANTSGVFTALVATPTTAANWDCQYIGASTGGTGGMLQSVYCATTGTETYTITSGSVSQINGTALDGASPAVGDRVLVTCAPASSGTGTNFVPSTEPANGIYLVTSNTTNLSLSRVSDLSGSVDPSGLSVYVEAGTDYGKSFWTCSSPTDKSTAFTYGTTNMGWYQLIGPYPGFSGVYLYGGTGAALIEANSALTGANQLLTLPGTAAVQVLDGEQFCTLTSAYTLTSQTAAQKLFNTSTNGAVTLTVGTYFFDCLITLTSLSASNSIFGWALTAGTATITAQLWESRANCISGTLATAAGSYTTVNTAANTAIVGGSPTSGAGYARITGKCRIGTAGTVIPQVSLNTAAAAVVGVDSYFRIWAVGSNTITTAGTWT